MISKEQYFAAKPHSQRDEEEAENLLAKVNALIDDAIAAGAFTSNNCPNTGSEISGSKGGSGDGGFRLQSATTGSLHSSHKEARGVDVYDPSDRLDEWLDTFEHGVGDNAKLERYGLYRESPSGTPTWVHLTTRPPYSGHRTFVP